MPRLARESSPEEWAQKGQEMFDQDRFKHAKTCFRNANLPNKEAVANAYFLIQHAESIPEADSSARRAAHIAAGDAFIEFITAYRWDYDDGTAYYRRAGKCYLEGNDLYAAAKAFEKGIELDFAAELYLKIRHYDDAVALFHQGVLSSKVAEKVRIQARLFYFVNNHVR
jgi:tetratricopeptide (TPR) repeat protein